MLEASTSEIVEGSQDGSLLNPEVSSERLQEATDIKEVSEKPPICQFFKRRKWCKFGSPCRFLHPKPNHKNEDASKGNQQTGCKEGRGGDKDSVDIEPNRQPLKDSDGRSAAADVDDWERDDDRSLNAESGKSAAYIPPFKQRHKPTDGVSSEESEAPVRAKDKSSKTAKACQYFLRTGRCRYGARCRQIHDRSNRVSSHETPALGGSDNDGAESVELIEPSGEQSPELQTDVGEKSKMCQFYAKTGRCRFGDRCHFIHGGSTLVTLAASSAAKSGSGSEEESNEKPGKPDRRKEDKENKTSSPNERKPPPRKVCKFFLSANGCSSGNSCKFSHSKHSNANAKSRQKCRYFHSDSGCSAGDACKYAHVVRTVKYAPSRPTVAPVKPQAELSLDTMNEEELKRLRDVEVTQLKKRYPHHKLTSNEGEETYTVNFHPTDPDWPYDVKELMLDVTFTEGYPKQRMEITVSQEQELPDTVHRLVSLAMSDWVTERYDRLQSQRKVELLFRPFLRWLDKQLEDIFTDALTMYKQELMAKAAGIKFVPVRELQERYRQDSTASEGDRNEETSNNKKEEERERSNDEDEEESEEEEEEEEMKQDKSGGGAVDPAKRGTEVKLYGLQLKEGIATLNMTRMALCVQCSRCKNKTELNVSSSSPTGIGCSKCDQQQVVTFRPAIVHQFSSVAGYLDLHQCMAFDVLLHDCIFQMGCFNCSKEMKLEGMMPGQLKNTWCGTCHGKMSLAMETVRFLQLQPQDIDLKGVQMLVSAKQKKVPKDPAIKDGLPLPSFGTCKHYKKSYRWLRFPCCGKAYPCDICHEEGDGGDHEMKYANRMICGHCAKEQYYAADKECARCGSNLTRKSSSHWEGGKGCRDKISMSKNDQQKYSNLNKTISKKASAKQPGAGGPKNTKLRRS